MTQQAPWYDKKGEEFPHTRKHKCRHRYVTCHATENATIKAPTWVKRQAQVCYLVTVGSRRPTANTHPILPLSHRTQQERKKRAQEPGARKQARKKTETHTRAEAGKKCMPGRRASQRRVEESVKSDEATKETGGSQQPSKGRAQGMGHGKHTASTTPQRSTGEGGTRGQGKGNTTHRGTHSTGTTHTAHTHTRAHSTWPVGPDSPPGGRVAGKGGRLNPDAPRHPCGAQPPTGHVSHGASAGAPQPHTHAHSTWVADPNSPPGGRAVRGGGAPDPRRPSQRRKAPPPGTPFRHPHSAQRRPARAHAVGPVLGPHARTNRTRDTRVAESRPPAPEDGRPGEGQRLTPDAPHKGGMLTPPGTAPHRPRGTQPRQGMQAKGTVLGAHSRTPGPTTRG